jgi:L-serine dehydratase
VQVALYGSLALTGVGHATDKAVLLGLMGETPQDVAPESVEEKLAILKQTRQLNLLGQHSVAFDPQTDLLWFKQEVLPGHPNGLKFSSRAATAVFLKKLTTLPAAVLFTLKRN